MGDLTLLFHACATPFPMTFFFILIGSSGFSLLTRRTAYYVN